MIWKFVLSAFIVLLPPLTVYGVDSCTAVLGNLANSPTDFHREWGVKLLPDGDKAFSDPEYLKNIAQASKLGTVSYYKYGPYYSEFNKLYKTYIRDFGNTDPYGPEILRITNTGTEANNALYEYAEYAFLKRTGKKAKRANLLYFGSPYGGTFGRIAEISVRYKTEAKLEKSFHVPTPYTSDLESPSPEESARLDIVEAKALDFIRRQVAKNSLEIGGIFLEPITTAKGLFFFRSKFLEKLRLLADELNIPIMADEIFTGGGRTGRFWASAHYDTFRPDLMTFGKGMGISGVAYFNHQIIVNDRYTWRWMWPSWENTLHADEYTYPEATLDNTSRVNPLALVQASQILQRIKYDDLETNAQTVGAYALAQIKQKAKQLGFENDIKGIGLLFDVGTHTDELVGKDRISHYGGRWSPPLTLTKEEIDALLAR